MAELVGAFGVPHTPAAPRIVANAGPDNEFARLFGGVREHVEAVQPDVLVMFDSDHLNTFFLDHLPTFCVGVVDAFVGPNDETPGLAPVTVPGHAALAGQLRAHGVGEGFDLSLTQHFAADHSVLVPLHFLTPGMGVPVVPVFVNGMVPPLPLSRRCFALGQAVRRAVEAWPDDLRVGVVASGSFSLEIGGPRMEPGKGMGVPDPGWVDTVLGHLGKGEVEELLEVATSERMARAGNVAGELLNWIAVLGAVGDRTPSFLEPQRSMGHAYAAWRWD